MISRQPGVWRHAAAGLVRAYREERHLRVHAAAACAAVVATWLARPGAGASAAVVAVIALVIAMEVMNSAVERAVDRAGRERHPLARDAKDMAAAAVVVAAAGALAVAAVVLGPRLGRMADTFWAWPAWGRALAAAVQAALVVLAAAPVPEAAEPARKDATRT